jgi:single-strand DNA-binding protein
MKALKNKVQLIGNLGADPEAKSSKNGQPYARMSIATNEYYTSKDGERIEETVWHTVVAFGKLAEVIVEHYHKGDQVLVDGKIQYITYTDQNNEMRKSVDIIVNDCTILNRKQTPETEAA